MNCYDFDKTIYLGDSSVDFYLFCLKRYPGLLRRLPQQVLAFIRHYVLHNISKTRMKTIFYRYFQDIPDIHQAVTAFWDQHIQKIQSFYLSQQQADDVIISASPEFFLKPVCKQLGIRHLIASPVDPNTGMYHGENCHGQEKVSRFKAAFPQVSIEAFYSDSLSDSPMAQLAAEAYLVKGEKILPWPMGTYSRSC